MLRWGWCPLHTPLPLLKAPLHLPSFTAFISWWWRAGAIWVWDPEGLTAAAFFRGRWINVVNSCSDGSPAVVHVCVHVYTHIYVCKYVYVCKYTHLLSGAPCPQCMLLGRRQKMAYFVLLTTHHYKAVVGWPQAGDPAHQAVWRHRAAPFAQIRVIQCLEIAVPVVLWAALWGDQGFGAQCWFGDSNALGRQEEQRESQSIPLPLSLGEEAPICCRWTYPHSLVDVHLSTSGLFILGVTEAMRVTLFGITLVWLWVTSMIP